MRGASRVSGNTAVIAFPRHPTLSHTGDINSAPVPPDSVVLHRGFLLPATKHCEFHRIVINLNHFRKIPSQPRPIPPQPLGRAINTARCRPRLVAQSGPESGKPSVRFIRAHIHVSKNDCARADPLANLGRSPTGRSSAPPRRCPVHHRNLNYYWVASLVEWGTTLLPRNNEK